MQIEIPPEAEPFVRARAEAAGFDNIRDYVLKLILEDDAQRVDLGRLEQLSVEGLETGDAGTLTREDWKSTRAQLEERIVQRQPS